MKIKLITFICITFYENCVFKIPAKEFPFTGIFYKLQSSHAIVYGSECVPEPPVT